MTCVELESRLIPASEHAPVPESIRRKCINPSCFGGNVILRFSGRMAVCPACDGTGEHGPMRETRERYYRGRGTALMLALQSGAMDGDWDDEIGFEAVLEALRSGRAGA